MCSPMLVVPFVQLGASAEPAREFEFAAFVPKHLDFPTARTGGDREAVNHSPMPCRGVAISSK